MHTSVYFNRRDTGRDGVPKMLLRFSLRHSRLNLFLHNPSDSFNCFSKSLTENTGRWQA